MYRRESVPPVDVGIEPLETLITDGNYLKTLVFVSTGAI